MANDSYVTFCWDNGCGIRIYSIHTTILFCGRKLEVSLNKPSVAEWLASNQKH